jgi:beta-galactosidase/beta-glucuronidase
MNIKDAVRTLLFGDKQNRDHHQLYTEWGEALDPEHVLTQYPRPQLRRDNYTILNGYWSYAITKGTTKPKEFDGKILVPFSPESVLSGVNRQLKPGEFLWYERWVPFEKRPGMRCILHFGAVDQSCEVYCNHVQVAKHGGGYLPFSIDITEDIKDGDNLLLLKVTDPSNSSYHSRGKQRLVNGGMWYTAQSGIWQTVWYEWVPETYITGIKITPDVKKGELQLRVNRSDAIIESAEPLYQVIIKEEDRILEIVTAYQNEITISLPEFICWSPENPFLYDMEIISGQDRVESYFAMRSVELKEDEEGKLRIFLNGKPYFQNGLLDQGYWPDGLYTAPSDEAMIYDIEAAKRLGFNMLRKHIKIEPLRWYYHCDRLGMLVWQDMVNGGDEYHMLLVSYLPTIMPRFAGKINDKHYALFGRANAESRREWSAECKETVELLYNHPCIVCWVPFNEGWGQFDAKEAYRLIRELDAGRLIDHASGWYDQGIGDFESVHNYFHPLRVKYKKRAIVFSEIGGYACYIEKHSYSRKVYGYRIYSSKEQLNEAFQKLYREELTRLKQEGLSAVVYTQLSDVEEEVNGLLTYDRKLCKVEPLSFLEKMEETTE